MINLKSLDLNIQRVVQSWGAKEAIRRLELARAILSDDEIRSLDQLRAVVDGAPRPGRGDGGLPT